MAKLNPFFEVEGKKYEIKRTRFLECEYEKLTQQSSMTEEEERLYAQYIKLETEAAKIGEKFRNAEEAYFDDILNETKKKEYLAFKELSDSKFNEIVEFGFKHKEFSVSKLEERATENGVQILILALTEQYNLSGQGARDVWDKFKNFLLDKYGIQAPREWILYMVQTLFESEEEEVDPFLKQARVKAQMKLEQRKGLSKIRK